MPSTITTASLTTIARKLRCIRASGVSAATTISSQPASAADSQPDRAPGDHRRNGFRAGQTPRRQPSDAAEPGDDGDRQTQEARVAPHAINLRPRRAPSASSTAARSSSILASRTAASDSLTRL